jgi:hypothetical protein
MALVDLGSRLDFMLVRYSGYSVEVTMGNREAPLCVGLPRLAVVNHLAESGQPDAGIRVLGDRFWARSESCEVISPQ